MKCMVCPELRNLDNALTVSQLIGHQRRMRPGLFVSETRLQNNIGGGRTPCTVETLHNHKSSHRGSCWARGSDEMHPEGVSSHLKPWH